MRMPLARIALVVLVTTSMGLAGGRDVWECARNGELKKVKQYIAKDASLVHAHRKKDGYTPLHMAAEWGKEDVVEYLLGKGANPEARGASGWTPIQMAEGRNHRAVARMLREGLEKYKKMQAAAAQRAQQQQQQQQLQQQQFQQQQFQQQQIIPAQQQAMTRTTVVPQQQVGQPTASQLFSGDVRSNLMAAKQNYDQLRGNHDRIKAVYEAVKADYEKSSTDIEKARLMLEYAYENYIRAQEGGQLRTTTVVPAVTPTQSYVPTASGVQPGQPAAASKPSMSDKVKSWKETAENAKDAADNAESTIDKVNKLLGLLKKKD